jgi:hypothetical protein
MAQDSQQAANSSGPLKGLGDHKKANEGMTIHGPR